jgi:hypothetical protein
MKKRRYCGICKSIVKKGSKRHVERSLKMQTIGEENKYKKHVITYGDTKGNIINMCGKHEKEAKEKNNWPKNNLGEELCTVQHGLHWGTCTLCIKEYKNN